MGDVTLESAKFVLAHLLTKEGPLVVGDIKAMQRALMDLAKLNIDAPNGVFGPGTSQAIMDHIGKNPELIFHLSETVRETLNEKGFEGDLISLAGSAHAVGADSFENETIASLIAKPYALNEAGVKFLQTKLSETGLYSGSIDGVVGNEMIMAVANYLKTNPDAMVVTSTILSHIDGMGEAWVNMPQDMATGSRFYTETVQNLALVNTGMAVSSVNYHLQHMLHIGGFGTYPDGAAGEGTQAALKEFQKAVSQEHSSLSKAWNLAQQAPAIDPGHHQVAEVGGQAFTNQTSFKV